MPLPPECWDYRHVLLRLPITFIVYFLPYTFIVKQKCISCGKAVEGADLQSLSEGAGNTDGTAAALHRNPTPCSSPVLPLAHSAVLPALIPPGLADSPRDVQGKRPSDACFPFSPFDCRE